MSPTRHVLTLALMTETIVALTTACALDPLDDENVDCPTVCERLSEKGCELNTVEGAGGATDQGPTGCLASCEDARRESMVGNCYQLWSDFAACLAGDSPVSCDGTRLDDVQGCDAERRAWDLCDGAECDLRGGLSANGTTADGQPYFLSYGWADAQCHSGMDLGTTVCSEKTCSKVFCCDNKVVAGGCVDGACASEQEVCGLLQQPPFALCAPP